MGFFKNIFNPNLEPEDEKPAEKEVVNDADNQAPETPDVPETPEVPESPEVPETPVDPESPEIPEAPEPPVTNKKEGLDLGDNAQAAVGDLITWIIDALAPLRGGFGPDAVHDMTIHVADPRARLLMGDTFIKKLRVELDNNLLDGISAGEILVADGLTDNPAALNVKPGLLQLKLTKRGGEPPKASGKAVIAIVEGTGSLKQQRYELDASSKTVFHIGRGKVVKKGGVIRINDIIINDEETDDKILAINRRVSSAQADILWRNGAFYLKAMPSGCRPEGGAATKVYHEEKFRELRDTFMPVLLHDGDFIELGGTLLLSFNIVNE